MAISYSASASDKFVGVSSIRTLSITTNSGDSRMIAGIFVRGGSGFSANFNGDSMTFVTSGTNGLYTLYVYELINPDVGTYDITFNWSGNATGVMMAATYQGDNTSVAITNFASASAATVNISAITGWTVLLSGNHHTSANSMTAGAGSTARSIADENIDHDTGGIFDSNAQVSGAQSMASSASGATYVGVIVTVPLLISSDVTDTVTVTDVANGLIASTYSDSVTTTGTTESSDWENKQKSSSPNWANQSKS